jgi:hypothetical protein
MKAKVFYEDVKRRMINVNKWKELCGNPGSTFQLADEKGTLIKGNSQKRKLF